MNTTIERRKTRQITAGTLKIGGDAPVSVQTMTNIPIEKTDATIAQITKMKDAGADIVRLAVRNEDAVPHLKTIIKSTDIPLVADIHFDYRLAIASIDAGIDKIRINPGNIGEKWKVEEVVRAASANNIPIRIGVNGGSINRKKYDHVTPASLVDSAMENILILEEYGFSDIAISIKSSDIFTTIEANRVMSETRDYPIHIGLTEAGYGTSCIIQSSVVVGHMLLQGIGDTIRVSMTGDPVEEVTTGIKILQSLALKPCPVKMISCPTCGRTAPDIDLLEIAKGAEEEITSKFAGKLEAAGKQITVAIMGCEVNGPGEAREADYGLAGGRNGSMLLFAKGEIIRKVTIGDAIKELIDQIDITLDI